PHTAALLGRASPCGGADPRRIQRRPEAVSPERTGNSQASRSLRRLALAGEARLDLGREQLERAHRLLEAEVAESEAAAQIVDARLRDVLRQDLADRVG